MTATNDLPGSKQTLRPLLQNCPMPRALSFIDNAASGKKVSQVYLIPKITTEHPIQPWPLFRLPTTINGGVPTVSLSSVSSCCFFTLSLVCSPLGQRIRESKGLQIGQSGFFLPSLHLQEVPPSVDLSPLLSSSSSSRELYQNREVCC